jgi:hypothetical protein
MISSSPEPGRKEPTQGSCQSARGRAPSPPRRRKPAPVVCMVSLRDGQTTFFASVIASRAKVKKRAPARFSRQRSSQAPTREHRQHAQDHCLLGEQVEASHAGSQNNQRQRKLDLVGHFVRALKEWQGRRESNPQPSVLETDALPIELYPCSRDYKGAPVTEAPFRQLSITR